MNIQEIKDRFDRDEQIEYLFFWSHRPNPDGTIGKTCFSQWFEDSFEIDGIYYPTAEHYMMAEKARLFEDRTIFTEILAANHPRQAQNWDKKFRTFRKKFGAHIAFQS